MEVLKSQDTVSQLRSSQEEVESLTDERDRIQKQLVLSQAAERRARQQLKEGNDKEMERIIMEVEEMKKEAQENEEMWRQRLQDAEKVSSSVQFWS